MQRSIAISIIGCYEVIGIFMSALTVYRLKIHGIRSKKNEKNLLIVTFLHILVDIVAMFIMIAEFLEWQFPLALFAVQNVFPVTYTVVILNSITIVLTNKRVRDAYFLTIQFWKKRVEDQNSSSRQHTSLPPTPKIGNVQLF
uniref:7TM_GPCR_Srx domain-containing protein n=2 Tax=Caenorhabditis tropicalis TaxID=1561998 RepID=A0A1I7TG24_9PELO